MSIDPTTEIPHEITFGQVYQDSRTEDFLQLVYIDRYVYILADEERNHRLGTRKEFQECVEEGRFQLTEKDAFHTSGVLDRVRSRVDEYREQDGYKAAHKADALEEALSILTDIGSDEAMKPVPFEELDNIGETAAANLRKAGFETCDDVRHAEDKELLNISWVGEKGVTSIREWCK